MENKWRVYLKPFDDSGNYASSWTEVTDDVDESGMGSVASDLDNTEYDIGIYRNSNFKLTLQNSHGTYSDVGGPQSIFHYKRADSLCRITWQQGESPKCGTAKLGPACLTTEVDVFTGLLNDDSLSMDLDAQKVAFTVLGRESMFLRTIVPFGTISNGDLLSSVIFKCLNQTQISNLLTVSAGNIAVGLDQTIDSISSLQNQTVQEGLNKLLLATNSVLYISNNTIYVSPRTPSATVKFKFYGQASQIGPENIQDIKAIKNGVAKVFNYFTWDKTTLSVQDSSSVTKYGSRKKALAFDFITDNTKRLNIMNSLLAEFKDPKQEFDLYTQVNHASLPLALLDRISIDEPTIYYPDQVIPICGIAVCGQAVLPEAQWAFIIDPVDPYKLIGTSIEFTGGMLRLKVRAI